MQIIELVEFSGAGSDDFEDEDGFIDEAADEVSDFASDDF